VSCSWPWKSSTNLFFFTMTIINCEGVAFSWLPCSKKLQPHSEFSCSQLEYMFCTVAIAMSLNKQHLHNVPDCFLIGHSLIKVIFIDFTIHFECPRRGQPLYNGYNNWIHALSPICVSFGGFSVMHEAANLLLRLRSRFWSESNCHHGDMATWHQGRTSCSTHTLKLMHLG